MHPILAFCCAFSKPMKNNLEQIRNLKTIRPLSHIAGWSSLVARQAHNLKVPGSNPGPAPNEAR